jgi:predicted cupin superfamily sugar epimerase
MTTRPPLAEALDLQPHPEGGWFRETFRSGTVFRPEGYAGPRAAATAIYFLLQPGESSAWHVVKSDEIWFLHSGSLELRFGGAGPEPSEPGGVEPSEPGGPESGEPGGAESSEPGGAEPSEPGGAEPSEQGRAEPSEQGRVEPSGPAGPAASNRQVETVVLDRANPQVLVPAGVWQSAFPAGAEPVLVSCVVSPGFDFADFRLA